MELSEFLLLQSSKANQRINNVDKLQLISSKEDGEFDSSGSFDDFMGDSSGASSSNDFGDFSSNDDFSMDGGFDDFGGDDSQGKLPIDTMSFLENVDESEVIITEELLYSFSTLYHDNLNNYDKLLTENLEALDDKDHIDKIKDQYKLTLKILKNYITNKYKEENLVARTTTFIEFKSIFQNLASSLNQIISKTSK